MPCSVPDKADSTKGKTVLRSFVRKIVVDSDRVTVAYKVSGPLEKERKKGLVLPAVTPGGAGVTTGRTFELEFSLTI